MTYPILENGLPIGSLTLEAQGLYVRFAARCAARPGVRRLWLCAETGCACLGVLTPEGDGLSLSRRLSKTAFCALPQPIRHAALAPPEDIRDDPARGFAVRILFGRRFLVFRT